MKLQSLKISYQPFAILEAKASLLLSGVASLLMSAVNIALAIHVYHVAITAPTIFGMLVGVAVSLIIAAALGFAIGFLRGLFVAYLHNEGLVDSGIVIVDSE